MTWLRLGDSPCHAAAISFYHNHHQKEHRKMNIEDKARQLEGRAKQAADDLGRKGDGFVAKYVKPNLKWLVLAVVVAGVLFGLLG
jgi:hypothetical protein